MAIGIQAHFQAAVNGIVGLNMGRSFIGADSLRLWRSSLHVSFSLSSWKPGRSCLSPSSLQVPTTQYFSSSTPAVTTCSSASWGWLCFQAAFGFGSRAHSSRAGVTLLSWLGRRNLTQDHWAMSFCRSAPRRRRHACGRKRTPLRQLSRLRTTRRHETNNMKTVKPPRCAFPLLFQGCAGLGHHTAFASRCPGAGFPGS